MIFPRFARGVSRRLPVMVVFILAHAAMLAAAPASTPIATVGLTPGWVTFGQAVPQGLAFDGLVVGALASQADVKTRWPDGSIRFAVVTTRATVAGDYKIADGARTAGAFTPVLPSGSVMLSIGGVAYTADIPAAPSSDLWLSGPLVYEGRSVVTPRAAGVAHPFIRVNFDVRVYNDGQSRVDVSVENVLDKTGATTLTYDAAISINGALVFSQPAVEHFYLTRWRKTFAVGGDAPGGIVPDLTPFNVSRALPPYLPLVTDAINVAAGPAYEILNAGALSPIMWDHGGRQELAPFPDWTARYLAHKRPEQRRFVLANGDLSGSWPVHVREAEDSADAGVGPERLPSLDQRPTIWLDDRASGDPSASALRGGPMPFHEYGDGIAGPGQSALSPDNAHQPSLAYVPYLLTGDRYYAEEMAFWANYCMIRTYNGDGVRGSTGILENNEVRGIGWALRNLVDAAAYYPGAEVSAYLAQKVTNNLTWLDAYASKQDPVTNPLKLLWIGYRPEPGFISLWEQSYLAYAIDRANQQGFDGGKVHQRAIADLQLLLFTSAPVYPRESSLGCTPGILVCAWSAPYLVSAGSVPDPLLWNGFQFHQTLAEITANTVGNPDLQRDFAGYYGPEARVLLMLGINDGRPGAQESYDYLFPFIGIDNSFCAEAYGGTDTPDRPDLGCRGGWAIDFYPPVPPPPDPAPAPSEASALVSPASGAVLAARQQQFTWSVGLRVTRYQLSVGSTVGGTNFFDGGLGTALSQLVTGLPADGSTIWVRLSSEIDGVLTSADYSFTAFTNHRPVVAAIAAQSGITGNAIRLQVGASDADGDALAYSALHLPAGLSIDSATGLITGALTTAGDSIVTVGASDGSLSGDTSFTWHVEAPPPPPPPPSPSPVKGLVNPGTQRTIEQDDVDLQIQVVLNPLGTLTLWNVSPWSFSAVNLPPGLTIDKTRGRIRGRVPTGAASNSPYHVTVTLTEGAHVFTVSFDWSVAARPTRRR
ncbi:MAG TPA: Ig domain-containing protein [Vicinamibacterales bacterium]|nr:Ig domain-containing protein [Vicinamibacterales bacterium]